MSGVTANRLLLTLSAVGLGVLAFPPFHWHPLALVAPLPFLLALRGARPAAAVLLGLLYGLGIFVGTLNWLVALFGSMAFLLFLILTIFPTIFATITASLGETASERRGFPFAIGVLWAGIEYFRSEWFTLRFPWITPGTALPPGHLTPLIGVYGVSLLVATGCACLVWRKPKTGAVLLVSVALATYLPQPPSGETTLKIAAIQGEEVSFDELLHLSHDTPGKVDAFVWPELSVVPDVRTKPEQVKALQELLKEKGADLITLGTVTKLEDERWMNTALTLGPDGVIGVHDKNRPVHFMDDGQPATEASVIETPLGKIATTICFDNDYEEVPRRVVTDGAELLLIPSMDAVHWTARQHLQHAELARHRAAENGRWVVVSSSSGLTQTIDPRGRRVARLPLFEPGFLVSEVGTRSGLTPYTRFGWLVGPACTILAVLLMILSSILSRRKRTDKVGDGPTGTTTQP